MRSSLGMLALALVALPGLASAQVQLPDGNGMATGQAGATSPAQQAFQQKIEAERQACRQQATAQGVQGNAMREAVMACMARIEPMAAKRMACVHEAQAKGVSGQDAMRPYVQACMSRQG